MFCHKPIIFTVCILSCNSISDSLCYKYFENNAIADLMDKKCKTKCLSNNINDIRFLCPYDKLVIDKVVTLPNRYFCDEKIVNFYNNINLSKLSLDLQSNVLLKQGIIDIYNRRYDSASEKFDLFKKEDRQDDEILYYTGFLELKKKNIKKAIEYFRKVAENKRCIIPASYMLLKCFVENKKYNEAIDFLNQYDNYLFKVSDLKNYSCEDILKLSGDVYSVAKNYEQSYKCYKKFLKLYPRNNKQTDVKMEKKKSKKNNVKREMSDDDIEEELLINENILDYDDEEDEEDNESNFEEITDNNDNLYDIARLRYAYVCHKLKHDDKTNEILTELVTQNNVIGQLSKYYFGYICFKRKQLNEAIDWFLKAYEIKYDRNIAAESLFNVIIINLELKKNKLAMEYIKTFKKLFFDSDLISDVNNIFAELSDKEGDYNVVISALTSLKNKSEKINKILQKNNINKGHKCFQCESYEDAIEYYKQSLLYPVNIEKVYEANFWTGECLLKLGEYTQAMKHYSQIPSSCQYYDRAIYGLAYANFYSKNYKTSLEYFDIVSNTFDDVELRKSDCLMMNKDYDKAIKIYDKNKDKHPDHCLYNLGIIYEMLNQYDNAQSNFDKIVDEYENSIYHNDAILESGKIYVTKKKYNEAIKRFSLLESREEKYIPVGLINKANVYILMNDIDSAKKCCIKILDNYIDSEHAIDALITLFPYSKSDEEKNTLEGYKQKLSNKNLLNTEYEIAKQCYYSGDYKKTVETLLKNIRTFPPNINDECYYMLGSSYQKLKSYDDSTKWFSYLSSKEKSLYYVISNLSIADNFRKQKKYTKAIDYFSVLKKYPLCDKDKYKLLTEMINTYRECGEYTKMIECAEERIKLNQVTNDNIEDSKLITAEGYVKQAKYDKAIKMYQEMSKSKNGEIAAKSQYMLAYIDNKRSNWEKSIEKLKIFINKFDSDTDCYDKSFLLLASNYISLKKYSQAEDILKSLIKYTSNSKTRTNAQSLLKNCKPKR